MASDIIMFCAVIATIGFTAMVVAISGAVVWGLTRLMYRNWRERND